MFTKSQIITAAAIVASASSVLAVPITNAQAGTEIADASASSPGSTQSVITEKPKENGSRRHRNHHGSHDTTDSSRKNSNHKGSQKEHALSTPGKMQSTDNAHALRSLIDYLEDLEVREDSPASGQSTVSDPT